MNKKILIISGVICLFLLIFSPMVTAENDYPKENGPYKVYIVGKSFGGQMGISPIWFDKLHGWQLGPLCHWYSPFGVGYDMEKNTLFVVNGIQADWEPPAFIYLVGFRGFAPGWFLSEAKTLIPAGDMRVFGICDEIDISSSG